MSVSSLFLKENTGDTQRLKVKNVLRKKTISGSSARTQEASMQLENSKPNLGEHFF